MSLSPLFSLRLWCCALGILPKLPTHSPQMSQWSEAYKDKAALHFGPPGDASYPTAQRSQGLCFIEDGPAGCDIFLVPFEQNGSVILSHSDSIDLLQTDNVTPLEFPAGLNSDIVGLYAEFTPVPEPSFGLVYLFIIGGSLFVLKGKSEL